jgi:ribosomal protein S10
MKYVIEHYSKEVRQGLASERVEEMMCREDEVKVVRKERRVWTLNRSPHGNKTAREQFGMVVWQIQVKQGSDDASRTITKVLGESRVGVKRKVVRSVAV